MSFSVVHVSGNGENGYDTNWLESEASVIDKYVKNRGRLIVVNSASRLKFYNRVLDSNEDWVDLNGLTSLWAHNLHLRWR